DAVDAVRLERLALTGRVVLEAVLRGRARVDERPHARLHAGVDDVRRAEDIRLQDLARVGLPRIGAARAEVEDDLRPRGGDDGRDGPAVPQVSLLDADLAAPLEAPGIRAGAGERVHLVPPVEQAPDEVRADESRRPRGRR